MQVKKVATYVLVAFVIFYLFTRPARPPQRSTACSTASSKEPTNFPSSSPTY